MADHLFAPVAVKCLASGTDNDGNHNALYKHILERPLFNWSVPPTYAFMDTGCIYYY